MITYCLQAYRSEQARQDETPDENTARLRDKVSYADETHTTYVKLFNNNYMIALSLKAYRSEQARQDETPEENAARLIAEVSYAIETHTYNN